MLIYRVEDSGLRGPYKNNRPVSLFIPELNTHGSENGRPGPDNDGVNKNWSHNYYCGFSSKNKLNKWFEGIQHKLHKHGFHISIYSIDERFVVCGKRQVLFRRDQAKLVRKLKLRKRRV